MLNFLLRTGSPDLRKLIYNTNADVFEHISSNGIEIPWYLLEDALKKDCFDVVRTLWQITSNNNLIEHLFAECCIHGKLDQAKFLWELTDGKINLDSDIFYMSLYEGHLETAKWLWQIGNFQDINFKYAFEECILQGYKDAAKWLAEISDGIIDLDEYRGKEISGSYVLVEGTLPFDFPMPVVSVIVDL